MCKHSSIPPVLILRRYGQSNPTFFVDDANDVRYILRKKPTGTIISPVAHQVDREYKVLKALGSVDGFPVPKVYCLCMDSAIIGTAFYVCIRQNTCALVLISGRSWSSSKVA
jgi:aminoglycoside phosphotransferase (APT) family kinase protein